MKENLIEKNIINTKVVIFYNQITCYNNTYYLYKGFI